MRALPLAAVGVLALVAAARAETVPAVGAASPRFEDFPAGPAYAGRVRLALGRDDVAFRTRLREAAGRAPDFAGHYVMALWGCGAGCVMGAAIDARSGRVVWLPSGGRTPGCCLDATAHPAAVEPVRHRLDSRLLVLTGRFDGRNGRDGGDNGDGGSGDGEHYYLIEGARFVPLQSLGPGQQAAPLSAARHRSHRRLDQATTGPGRRQE